MKVFSARASKRKTTMTVGVLCAEGYTESPDSDVGGWGKINGKGGGQQVESASECAGLCDSEPECGSFEFSPTEKKCNLNLKSAQIKKGSSYKDYALCVKDRGIKTTALNKKSLFSYYHLRQVASPLSLL